VLATLAAATLAIFGHDWLHRAFRVLLCISLPLMLVVSVGVLLGAAGGGPAPAEAGFTWAAFLAQFSAGAAYNITYAPYVSDYSRYLPSSTPARKVIAAVFFGASASAIWLIALGAWLATRLGATDGLTGLQQAGNAVLPYLGDAAALLSALALWATMGMNAYGGALTVLTGIDSVRPLRPRRAHRVVAVVALAVVWFAISQVITSDAVSAVATGLTLMLYLLVPWTAANLVDFFFVRRGHYAITDLFNPNGIYGAWGRRGLIAYGVGFVFEIPFMILPDLGGWSYTGPMAKALDGVDIAWIVGLIVSGSVYWWLTRTLDTERERRAVAESERELVAA
jgi:purine-cytosine permease-like protein